MSAMNISCVILSWIGLLNQARSWVSLKGVRRHKMFRRKTLGGTGVCSPGKFLKSRCSLMTFPAFWVHYYTILVDDLWHKLCDFLSKYLVWIYFSQSTLLTSFPAVMGGLKVLDGKGEEIGYGEKQTTRISSLNFLSFLEILARLQVTVRKRICWFVKRFKKTKRQTLTLQITG